MARSVAVSSVLLVAISWAWADEPPAWQEFTVDSPNGQFRAGVKPLEPGSRKPFHERVYTITVYDEDGEVYWRQPYYYDGYLGGLLSDDGEVFAYVSFWYYHDKPVVHIYRKDREPVTVKGWRFGVLPTALERTLANRVWLKAGAPYSLLEKEGGGYLLEIWTRDDRRHIIDADSGGMSSSVIPGEH